MRVVVDGVGHVSDGEALQGVREQILGCGSIADPPVRCSLVIWNATHCLFAVGWVLKLHGPRINLSLSLSHLSFSFYLILCVKMSSLIRMSRISSKRIKLLILSFKKRVEA